jgi:ribosome-binding factor A
MKPLRSKRLGVEIKREISRIIEFEFRTNIPAMTTITEVRLTPDLRIARVYYSVLGSADDKKRVGEFLTNATGRMRSLIAARITMRYHPSLEFRLDDTLEYAQRIEDIIEKIHQEPQASQTSEETGDF